MAQAFIKSRLCGVHEWRNVDYVEVDENGDFRCELCGTGWIYGRKGHFHGRKHVKIIIF